VHNSSWLESGEERCGRAHEQLRGMLVGGEAAGQARWAALEQGPLARHVCNIGLKSMSVGNLCA
jgi:hypothetical protein